MQTVGKSGIQTDKQKGMQSNVSMLGSHKELINSSWVGWRRLHRRRDIGVAPGRLSEVPQGAKGGGGGAVENTS